MSKHVDYLLSLIDEMVGNQNVEEVRCLSVYKVPARLKKSTDSVIKKT